MATTPKGIYYPNNYNEIADIPEDMKKMAESIDEVFENTDSDLSDIKEEQTTQNNRLNSLEVDNTTNKSDILTNKQEINNIKTEQTEQNTNISTNATNIESLQEENENLKKIVSQLPQVTGQGTSITLENTIEATFTIFDVEGNSTQDGTPSPDNEVPIESAGDNENLFDGETELGSFNNSGQKVASTAVRRNVNPISVKPNSTYILGRNGTELANRVYYYTSNNTFISAETTTGSFTTPNNCNYINFISDRILTDFANIKLEKSNKASGYSPYGMGSINEKIQNKNVLDYKEIFNNAEDYSSAFKIYRKKLQPNTSYTTSSNFPYTNNETGFIVVNSTDEPSTVNYGLRGEITTTTNSDGIIRIYIRKFSEQQIIPKLENFESGTYYIQTEPGSTATSYVPHEEQDYSIYTQQPFRSIGDVRDKFVKKDGNWFERHYIGEVVLNGTENWNYEGGRFVLNFLISALDISGRQEVYSNYFEYLPSGSADYGIFVYKASNTNSQIYILDKDYTTVEELKTGLSTHNVVVQYLSAEPLDLPCTETQIQQLENKPSTYKDFTIIQSEDETEAYLEVSGIYDLNKLITRTEVLESES